MEAFDQYPVQCVYVLHFDQPYHHAQHYVGWTENFDGRMWHHQNGTGAKLTRALMLSGIGWQVARVFQGEDRAFERKLHRTHHTSRYCPICHEFADSCICPECEICGVAGDPACINIHMPWEKWGHFKFQIEIAHQLRDAQREPEERPSRVGFLGLAGR